MAWDIYNRARTKLHAGEPAEALHILQASETDPGAIWSHFACLESQAQAALGENQTAAATLEKAAARGTDNYWVYHGLASRYRALGDLPKAFAADRHIHTLLGWPESERNGYVFSHDYFSANIADWSRWFAEWITAAPIACLEIGSWQGGSATWLLDKVVAPRGGSLTCIDTFAGSSEHAAWLGTIGRNLEEIFDDNIQRTGHADLCHKWVGRSQDVLRWLHEERFDFIYVDGAHEAKYVIQDALLAWPLLHVGGCILFDDTRYRFRDRPEQNTETAVAAFLSWFADEIEVLVPNGERQLLLRKRG